MRRLAGLVLVALVLAPAGLAPLAGRTDAARCAMVCHLNGAASDGSCCGTEEGRSGPSDLRSCPQNDAGAVPSSPFQPALPAAAVSLSSPEIGSAVAAAADGSALALPASPLDHVPLLLS